MVRQQDINWAGVVIEAIGTFSFIFISGTLHFKKTKTDLAVGGSMGLILGAFIFIGAKISGGAFNPAITVG